MVWCRASNGKKQFVEVKSSSQTKNYFDISIAEVRHAHMHREQFSIVRVCGVGTSCITLSEIDDPVGQVEQGRIRNCLILPAA